MSKPTKELKSTPFTKVIELERIVTPDEEKRVDHIFVRNYWYHPTQIYLTLLINTDFDLFIDFS